MVPDHWSNDAMVSMDRCGLETTDSAAMMCRLCMYVTERDESAQSHEKLRLVTYYLWLALDRSQPLFFYVPQEK